MSAELTQAERDLITAKSPGNDETAGWEYALLHRTVEKILSDRLARVEALAERDVKWRAEHALMSDCGCSYKDCFECGKGCRCVHTPYADLRAALAPAPTEAANGRQAGSDERVGTKEDA